MRRIVVLLICLLAPLSARAQMAAGLIADSVTVTANNRLMAQGNVEVLYDGTKLSAAAIIYDQATDSLTIEGPILIRTADGTILTATRATLDPRLENGILISARLVLAEQLQLAANQIDRVDGRFTQLSRVAATSCNVCEGRAPLWEIRASRVVHDQAEQQLYFDNASLRIRGLPIFWLPRMRLPDPTLKRATGLLIPELRSTDQLGLGIKLPYFIRLGDYRDLTLTPYLSPNTSTLEARYRQSFVKGDVEVNMAVSQDQLVPGATRGYLFATGNVDLIEDFKLDFGLQMVSDSAYLLDYGKSSKDRLESYLRFTRVGERNLFLGDFTSYRTLRDDELPTSLPPYVAEISYERDVTPALIGGTMTFTTAIDSYVRTSSTPGEDGRDVSRFGTAVDWRRDWVLSSGIVAEATAGLDLDYYQTWEDPAFEGSEFRTIGSAGMTLRWPLAAQSANGSMHILEPVLSYGVLSTNGAVVPNEDSRRVEFDEGNLYAMSHFPGQDVIETGQHLSLGMTWSRFGASGIQSRLGFGKIFRDTDLTASDSSGLAGFASDWLLAGHIQFPSGLSIDGRTLLNDDLSPTKTAARLSWTGDKIALDAAYVWLIADPDEDRTDAVSEWTLDTTYRINDIWTVALNGRYDVATATPAQTGIRIGWENECIAVDLSASRRYTSSTTVDPSTDYGLSISLKGFSAGRTSARPTRQCKN